MVSLAASRGVGEVWGFNHSINHRMSEAKWFYLIYTLAHVGGAAIIFSGINLVRIVIETEVMNTLLLPLVLGFLLLLEARALPPKWRMRGVHQYTVWSLSAMIMGFGLTMGVRLLVGM